MIRLPNPLVAPTVGILLRAHYESYVRFIASYAADEYRIRTPTRTYVLAYAVRFLSNLRAIPQTRVTDIAPMQLDKAAVSCLIHQYRRY